MIAGDHHVLVKVELHVVHAVFHPSREAGQSLVAAFHAAITLIDFGPHIRLPRGLQSLDTLMVGLIGLVVRCRHHIDSVDVPVTVTNLGRKTLDHLVVFFGFIQSLGRVAGGKHCGEQHHRYQTKILHAYSFDI